ARTGDDRGATRAAAPAVRCPARGAAGRPGPGGRDGAAGGPARLPAGRAGLVAAAPAAVVTRPGRRGGGRLAPGARPETRPRSRGRGGAAHRRPDGVAARGPAGV